MIARNNASLNKSLNRFLESRNKFSNLIVQ